MLMESQAEHLQALTKPVISASPGNSDSLGSCSVPASSVQRLPLYELKVHSDKNLVAHLHIVLVSRIKCPVKLLFDYNSRTWVSHLRMDTSICKWQTDRQNICYLVFYEPLLGGKLESTLEHSDFQNIPQIGDLESIDLHPPQTTTELEFDET